MNQVLVIGSANSGKLTLVKELFGDVVEIPKDLTSHSGLIFNDIEVKTKYYQTKFGLWIDEFNERGEGVDINEFRNWCDELLSQDASILREVIKGIIFTFNTNDDNCLSYITDASEILLNLLDQSFDDQWDGIKLAVGFSKHGKLIQKDHLLEMDDIWLNNGFEFIWFEEHSKDDMKMGKERVMEVLTNNDWNSVALNVNDNNDQDEIDDEQIDEMFSRLLDDHNHDNEPKDLNFDELITKLQDAKFNVSQIDNDNEKRKMAINAISNVIKYL